ncbi:hypothetical protein GCK72_018950 [Caenorhabditis remanei]|uniref:T20D4.11-like domain-containing protein n=2 Tax=Caenorhabditis remanei TaxID=31234 RepID=E3M042_CAERE|nr:hypothetical protein GCK72_018950 [Caenorhabditis remanei]EFO87714.1 hypothetical protein CRE_05584 [Caenorhabditis remanei]KAF1752395.1 hypothetical protein GCK72_018950 [Caenorhabditis remanei]
MRFSGSLILASFIFESVYGVLEEESSQNCGAFQLAREDLKCLFKQFSFAKDVVMLAVFHAEPTRVQKLRQACNSLQDCYASLKCRKDDMEYVKLANDTKSICAGLLYLSTDFSECKKKIDTVEGYCQFGNTCETIFGENNCGKLKISENCGVEEWIRFKEVMINFHKSRFSHCNFDQYKDL